MNHTDSALGDKDINFLPKALMFDARSELQSAVQIEHWIMTSTGALKIVDIEAYKFSQEVICILPK
jgi:hypothetical protein